MRFRPVVCLFAALVFLSASAAHAQFVSVYGLVSGVKSSNVQTSSGGGWGSHYGGGATFNFLNLPVVKLGLDARGGVGRGTTKTDTAELSLRLGVRPPVINLKPFVQVGVGYAAATVPNGTTKYVTVGGHAGVDRSLIPFLDWRIVDVGYSHGYNQDSGSGNKPGANFFSIGTGLVAHF